MLTNTEKFISTKFIWNENVFIYKYALENVVCKNAAILPKPQYVN